MFSKVQTLPSNLLGAMHGDPYIRNTKYEGGKPRDAVKYLLSFKTLPESLRRDLITALICLTKEDVIHRLKKGKKALFLGGWYGNPAHSVIFEADPAACTFSIYNGGDGLQYHNTKRIGGKDKVNPKFTLKNIPPASLLDSNFWGYLEEMATKERSEPGKSWNAEVLYTHIKETLRGEEDKDPVPDWKYTTRMDSGSCWWKSLLAFCKLNMTQSDYAELKYRFKIDCLAIESSKKREGSDLRLVRLAVGKFAHSIGKYKNYWMFSDVKWLKAIASVEDRQIKEEEQELLTGFLWYPRYLYKIENVALDSPDRFFPIEEDPLFDCIGGLTFEQVIGTEESLTKKLARIVDHLEGLQLYERKTEHRLICREAIRALPKWEALWTEIPKDELEEVCQSLFKLLGALNWSAEEEPKPLHFLQRVFLLYAAAILIDKQMEPYEIKLLYQYSFFPKIVCRDDITLIDPQDLTMFQFIRAFEDKFRAPRNPLFPLGRGRQRDRSIILTVIPRYPLRSKLEFPLVDMLEASLKKEGLEGEQINARLSRPESFSKAFSGDYPKPILELWGFVISAFAGLSCEQVSQLKIVGHGLQANGYYVTYTDGSNKTLGTFFREDFNRAIQRESSFEDTGLRELAVYDALKEWEANSELLHTEEGFRSLYGELFSVDAMQKTNQMTLARSGKLRSVLPSLLRKLIKRTLREGFAGENLDLLRRAFTLSHDLGVEVPVDVLKIFRIVKKGTPIPEGFLLSAVQNSDHTTLSIFAYLYTAFRSDRKEEHFQLRRLLFSRSVLGREELKNLNFWKTLTSRLRMQKVVLRYDFENRVLYLAEDRQIDLKTGVLSSKGKACRDLSRKERRILSGEQLSKKAGVQLSSKRYLHSQFPRVHPALRSSRFEGWLGLDDHTSIFIDSKEKRTLAVTCEGRVDDLTNHLHLLHTFEAHPHLENLILRLETQSFHLLWGDEERVPKRLEFPRLNYSFTIQGEELHCEQFPGYVYRPYLRDFPSAFGNQSLMLANKQGNEMLILFNIGYRESDLMERPFLQPGIYWPQDVDLQVSSDLFTRKSENDPFEGSRIGLLRLIRSLLYMRRYEQAVDLFYTLPRRPQLNEEEKQVAKKIFELRKLFKDPGLSAFYVHFGGYSNGEIYQEYWQRIRQVTASMRHDRRTKVDDVFCFLRDAIPIAFQKPQKRVDEVIATLIQPKVLRPHHDLHFDRLDFPIGQRLLKDINEARERIHSDFGEVQTLSPEIQEKLKELLSRRPFIQRYLKGWIEGTPDLVRMQLAGEREEITLKTAFNWLVTTKDETPQGKALAEALLYYDYLTSLVGVADRVDGLGTVKLHDSDKSRRIAAFQYKMGITLRPEQRQLATYIGTKPRQVFCSPCGSGKSAAITMLIKELTDKVVVNVVPSEQFETHLKLMNRQSIKLKGRPAGVFRFSRNSPTDCESLKAILEHLQFCKENELLIVTTPSDLQSFFLTEFILCGEDKQSQFYKIQDFFKKECLLLADEIHRILRANWELNFGTDEQKVLPKFRRDIPLMIYKIYTAEKDKTISTITRKVAEKLVPENERETCYLYLRMKPEQLEPEQLQKWLDGHDEDTRNRLMLARAHLQKYLKFTLHRRCFVDYGPIDGVDVAVPYQANNKPIENSSFTFYDTVVNLTIQMYLETGLTDQQVIRLLTLLKKQNQQEGGQKTCAQAIFDKLTSKHISLASLKTNHPEALKPYIDFLKKRKSVIFYLLEHFILPGITVDAAKYHSTGHDILNMFDEWVGLTATPSNRIYYPEGIQYHFDRTPKADWLRNLTREGAAEIVRVKTVEMAEHVRDGEVCCVLDPGAHFRGQDNREVALELIQKASPVKKVAAYFDLKTNHLMVVDREGKTAQYQESVYSVESILWYNDQWHCTGHDSKKPKGGVGVILLTKGMTFTALYQAAERMRDLGGTQKVRIVISDSVAKEMGIDNLDLSEVIGWALHNEGRELEAAVPAAFKELMLQVCRRHSDSEERNFFRESLSYDQYMVDGSLYPMSTAIESLRELRDEYGEHLGSEGRAELATLFERAKKLLPEGYRLAGRADYTQTAEQQVVCQSQEQAIDPSRDYCSVGFNPASVFEQLPHPTGFFRAQDVFQVEGFESTLFFSQNFLRRCSSEIDFGVFCRFFRKINYVVDVNWCYLVVTKDEADRILSDFGALDEDFSVRLYHISSSKPIAGKGDTNILPVLTKLKFLNGCTVYRGEELTHLKRFLSEDKEKKKRLFDLLYYQRRGGVTQSYVLEGTYLERLLG